MLSARPSTPLGKALELALRILIDARDSGQRLGALPYQSAERKEAEEALRAIANFAARELAEGTP